MTAAAPMRAGVQHLVIGRGHRESEPRSARRACTTAAKSALSLSRVAGTPHDRADQNDQAFRLDAAFDHCSHISSCAWCGNGARLSVRIGCVAPGGPSGPAF